VLEVAASERDGEVEHREHALFEFVVDPCGLAQQHPDYSRVFGDVVQPGRNPLHLCAIVRQRVGGIGSVLGGQPAIDRSITASITWLRMSRLDSSLRDELAGTGVTVTAVLPSAVRTDLVSGIRLGGVLPTVDPDRIAAAVVGSCGHRRPIVAVPGWMRAYEPVAGLLPDWLLGTVRGRLTRERVLRTLDVSSRAGYDDRVRCDAATDRRDVE
jgi:NAD(P)-dependent dehydrogenase (short-subunit alcohol dehydrogenase family)